MLPPLMRPERHSTDRPARKSRGNLDLLDFSLLEAGMDKIGGLDATSRRGPDLDVFHDGGHRGFLTFMWILQAFMCLLNGGEFLNPENRLRLDAPDLIQLNFDG